MLLFQSLSASLLAAYTTTSPFPFGTVFGQEIFQSGVIPSDTDFRIFRDYGKIPGLDMAYVDKGYVYHTEYDTVSEISLGTVHMAGETLLALVTNLITKSLDTDTHQEDVF